jgi:CheY-like chemotaxis protein/predicted  nucleic acid-binding Zn-ribbon protein
VDIVLIAKEVGASSDEGYVLANKLRADSQVAEVPFIILSSKLTNADFAKHQKTHDGANAYLKKPLALPVLIKTIEAVTGLKFPAEKKKVQIKKAPKPPMPGLNVVLVESRKILSLVEKMPALPGIEMTLTLFADEVGETPVESVPESSAEELSTNQVPNQSIEPSLEQSPGKSPEQPSEQSVATAPPAAEEIAVVASPEISASAPTEPPSIPLELPIESQIPAAVQEAAGGATAEDAIELDLSKAADAGIEIQLNSDSGAATDSVNATVNDSSQGPMEISIHAMDAPAESASPTVAMGETSPEPVPPPNETIAMGESFSVPNTSQLAVAPEAQQAIEDDQAAKDLPYLFGTSGTSTMHTKNLAERSIMASTVAPPDLSKLALSSDGDIETMKKYLMMREQDIAILSAQLTYAKEELIKAEQSIGSLNRQVEDLMHGVDQRNQRIESLEKELLHAGKSKDSELEQIRFDLKSKIDRIKFLEDQLNASALQHEKLRERVRQDIRKIRAREKELENKLEILKKDSETLIAGREAKILELKRKIDLLEFNYDTLQDQNETEKQQVANAHEKIAKVVKVLKLAIGIIEGESSGHQNESEEADLGAA